MSNPATVVTLVFGKVLLEIQVLYSTEKCWSHSAHRNCVVWSEMELAALDGQASLVRISWNTCGIQSYAESTSVPQDGSRSTHHFGCHSLLELVFSDGTVWQTHKYLDGSRVRLDFMRGIAAGELFKGPVQGDCINAGITGHKIRYFVIASPHRDRYDTRDFNCHHYAQDVWNFCVTFRKQVWWRPDISKPLVRLGSFRFAQCEWTRNRFGFGLYSHGLFRGEQIDWCQLSPYAILIGMGMGSTPKKWGSEMKAISGGLNLVSEFNPEKLCSEMKGISAGLNWMRVPVQPRKVRFRDESHQWGVEPRVGVQPRKVVLRDERYQWGVEPGCGFQFNPEKWGSEMKAINGGLNLGSEFNPEKLCSEMKGISGGLNQDVGPSGISGAMGNGFNPDKWGSEMKAISVGWTWGLSSTPKSCAQRWKVSVRGWTGTRFQFNPEKWGSEMNAINGGLNLVSEFNPEKLCLEMKGTSAGLNWMRVPVQPRKVRFRDESHQWGVEPRVGVQPRKVVLRDERYQWGVEPGCGFQFNPEKWGSEMKAINGGLNLGSEFNPEKLCSEMKGISGGLNQDVGPSGMGAMGNGFNPDKWGSEMKSHQCGVEPGVWVQPRKVVLRDERYQWGVEPGCGFQFNPEKWHCAKVALCESAAGAHKPSV